MFSIIRFNRYIVECKSGGITLDADGRLPDLIDT